MLCLWGQIFSRVILCTFFLFLLIYDGLGFRGGVLVWVFGVGFFSWWGFGGLWCGAFWVFWGWGFLYKHKRITLGKMVLRQAWEPKLFVVVTRGHYLNPLKMVLALKLSLHCSMKMRISQIRGCQLGLSVKVTKDNSSIGRNEKLEKTEYKLNQGVIYYSLIKHWSKLS